MSGTRVVLRESRVAQFFIISSIFLCVGFALLLALLFDLDHLRTFWADMRFLCLPTAIAFLVVYASAQDPTVGFDPFGQPNVDGAIIPAGKPFNITWSPTKPLGNISILLMQGPTEVTQNIGDPIVC